MADSHYRCDRCGAATFTGRCTWCDTARCQCRCVPHVDAHHRTGEPDPDPAPTTTAEGDDER